MWRKRHLLGREGTGSYWMEFNCSPVGGVGSCLWENPASRRTHLANGTRMSSEEPVSSRFLLSEESGI